MTDDELIARYIEQHPDKRGLDEARLIQYGISVWAIIGALESVHGDIDDVAAGYEIPRKEVEAALAYYRRYKCLIDNRIFANSA